MNTCLWAYLGVEAGGRFSVRWAMALVLERHEPDQPLIGTSGNILARDAGTGGGGDATAGYDAGVWAGKLGKITHCYLNLR